MFREPWNKTLRHYQGWAYILFKRTEQSLRSFPFFIKERNILFGFISHTNMENLPSSALRCTWYVFLLKINTPIYLPHPISPVLFLPEILNHYTSNHYDHSLFIYPLSHSHRKGSRMGGFFNFSRSEGCCPTDNPLLVDFRISRIFSLTLPGFIQPISVGFFVQL